jgi:hypothetical protein
MAKNVELKQTDCETLRKSNEALYAKPQRLQANKSLGQIAGLVLVANMFLGNIGKKVKFMAEKI